ncbi:hypothetical protein McPS_08290 [Marichromatium sp. PS1]
MLAQLLVLVLQQEIPAKEITREQHQEKRRKDPLHPPAIEIGQTESTGINALEYDRGDKKAGDHKENVNANEATPQMAGKGVKKNDKKNGDSPEPVDIWTICGMTARIFTWTLFFFHQKQPAPCLKSRKHKS